MAIVITVSGGCVRSVYSDDPNLEVHLVDWDGWDDDADDTCEIELPSPAAQRWLDPMVDSGTLTRTIDEPYATYSVNPERFPHTVF